jgi:protocatechuate 3,4-dioxygenase beta subunit
MFDLTRREWFIRALSLTGAAFASQLPPGFGTAATPPCDPSTKPTPARKQLPDQTGAPGRELTLDGAVIGIRCGLIAGAVVTASAGGTKVTATTDAGGRYRLRVRLPKVTGALRVNLHVDVPPKAERKTRTTLSTFLFLPDEVARAENAKAPGFDPLLRMKLVKQTAEAIEARFDVILDL